MQALQAVPKLNIHKTSEGRHTLLQFSGVVDEEFNGQDLAKSISTDVLIIQLAGIKRITSFGIREWVGFIETVTSRCKSVFLVDCAPRFVVQLNMVVGFVGHSAVLSILAPYICENCGHSFERRMDVIGNEAEIRSYNPSQQGCESCGQTAEFDDDPARFFSFLSNQPQPQADADTAAFLSRYLDYQIGQATAKVRVTKLVEGNDTVVRLMGEMNDTLPVSELQDGLEGSVALDVLGITRATPSGLQNWRTLLISIVNQVSVIRIVGLSSDLLPAVREFLHDDDVSLELHSVKLPFRCESCSTSFNREVNVVEHGETLKTATAPAFSCDDCGNTLACTAEPKTLIECSEIPIPGPAPEVLGAVEKTRKQQELADREAQGAGRKKQRWPLILVGSSLAGAAAALGLLLFYPSEAPTPASRAVYHEASHLSAPPWKDKHLFREDGRVIAVSQSTLSADKAVAFTEGTHSGIEELLKDIAEQNQDPQWAERVGRTALDARKEVLQRLDQAVRSRNKQSIDLWRRRVRNFRERIARSLGETSRELAPPIADQNYWESYKQDGELFYRVWARVALAEPAYEKLAKHYTAQHTSYGATVVPYFPLLSWKLAVDRGAVVLRVDPASLLGRAGLQQGDILLKVNDLFVADGLGFERQMNHEHLDLRRKGGTITLDLVNLNGERRKITAAIKRAPTAAGRPGQPAAMPPANIWHDDPTQ